MNMKADVSTEPHLRPIWSAMYPISSIPRMIPDTCNITARRSSSQQDISSANHGHAFTVTSQLQYIVRLRKWIQVGMAAQFVQSTTSEEGSHRDNYTWM